MKTQIPKEERQAPKERYKGRKKRNEDPDQKARLGRLAWIIQNHGLEIDERSPKRAEKCIVMYDLNAINKSRLFLKL